MLAEANIRHPARVLVVGKAGSGKTYLSIRLIDVVLRSQIDRLIGICPTWLTQAQFRVLDNMVNFDRDIFTDLTPETFKIIYKQIITCHNLCIKQGRRPIRTLLFIDDCGSDPVIHGGRISHFGKLAIQMRPLGVSAIITVQNPKLVSPNFRENANHFIFFPTQRTDYVKWICQEYCGGTSPQTFYKILERAWEGADDDEDDEENPKRRWLYILGSEVGRNRFFANFETELRTGPRKLIWRESGI